MAAKSGFQFNPATPSFSPAFSPSLGALEEGDGVPHDEDERERVKRLAREERQVAQVEAYFSDANLIADEYLQFAMATTPGAFRGFPSHGFAVMSFCILNALLGFRVRVGLLRQRSG